MKRIYLLLLSTGLIFWPTFAFSGNLDTGFELDGDAFSQATDDWNLVINGGSSAFATSGLLTDVAPASIYTGGQSKDTIDIPAWKHTSGSVPDKDDITHAFAAAYNVDGELIVRFGANRFDNSGDAMLGFWFLQDNVAPIAQGKFSGAHKMGDLLVLVDFVNGGTVPEVAVFKWVGVGGDQNGGTLQLMLNSQSALCSANTPNAIACAITNSVRIPSPWSYISKSGDVNFFPIATFFEGAINMSKLFQSNQGQVPCFSTFLAETRSSSSVTATLKDFAVGAFKVCALRITKECVSSDVSSDESGFTSHYIGNVTNVGFGTVYDVAVVDKGQAFIKPQLAPGETFQFAGDFTSNTNPDTNVAEVYGSSAQGQANDLHETSNVATCPVVVKHPALEVSKSCWTDLSVVGNLVVVKLGFNGTVCNTGDIGIDNIVASDTHGTSQTSDDFPISLYDPNTNEVVTSLESGECAQYEGSYTATPNAFNGETSPSDASFNNTVTVSGNGRLGLGEAHDDTTATCSLCP